MSKRPSFDLLDAHLDSEVARFNSLAPDEHLAIARAADVVVSPHYWAKYGAELTKLAASLNISWRKVPFKDLPKHLETQLKNDPSVGVYMFVAQPTGTVDGLPGLVFYVGIAGERDSGRALGVRLADYLNFEKVKKRKRVHRALKMYYAVTSVWYACLKATGQQLANLETALHGFFYPWASDRDFPGEIQEGRNAW